MCSWCSSTRSATGTADSPGCWLSSWVFRPAYRLSTSAEFKDGSGRPTSTRSDVVWIETTCRCSRSSGRSSRRLCGLMEAGVFLRGDGGPGLAELEADSLDCRGTLHGPREDRSQGLPALEVRIQLGE